MSILENINTLGDIVVSVVNVVVIVAGVSYFIKKLSKLNYYKLLKVSLFSYLIIDLIRISLKVIWHYPNNNVGIFWAIPVLAVVFIIIVDLKISDIKTELKNKI
jgi:hypothetical protein